MRSRRRQTDRQTRPCKISKINIRCQSWQIRDRVPRFWRGCVYPHGSQNMLISRRNKIDRSAFESWESSEKCALCRPCSLVSKSSRTNEGERFQLRIVNVVNIRITKIKTYDLGRILFNFFRMKRGPKMTKVWHSPVHLLRLKWNVIEILSSPL